MKKARVLAVIVCMMAAVNFASADTIRGIEMDFVTIGNAGNAADTGMNDATRLWCGQLRLPYRQVRGDQCSVEHFYSRAGAPTGNDNGYDIVQFHRCSAADQ